MNDELARLYNTNVTETGYDADAMEKMAQFALLSREAAAQGIDLSNLTPDEQNYVIAEMQKQAGADPEQEKLAEAQAKFEEADYIGRIIAHSFWQEKTAIERTAASADELKSGWEENIKRQGKGTPTGTESFRQGGKATRHGSGNVDKSPAPKGTPQLGGKGTAPKKSGPANQTLHNAKQTVSGAADYAAGAAKHYGGKALNFVKAHPKATAAAALGTAALGAGGVYAAGKHGSAMDSLVDQVAYEILSANGYVDQDGSVIPPQQEKVAEDFDTFVTQAAMGRLAELGYPVE